MRFKTTQYKISPDSCHSRVNFAIVTWHFHIFCFHLSVLESLGWNFILNFLCFETLEYEYYAAWLVLERLLGRDQRKTEKIGKWSTKQENLERICFCSRRLNWVQCLTRDMRAVQNRNARFICFLKRRIREYNISVLSKESLLRWFAVNRLSASGLTLAANCLFI